MRPSRLRKKAAHHKDTKAPGFRKGWFAWFLDKHFLVSFQLPSFLVKSFKMSEMIVRVYGNAAVVTGLAEVEGESMQTGEKKPFSFKMRFLNVWEKSGHSWKITVSCRTGVRAPAK